MMSAGDYLRRGEGILDERAREYDRPGGERSAAAVAAAWSAITGKPMSEEEAWLFLVLLKAKRLHDAPGPHDDSATDGAVYFALMGESKHAASSGAVKVFSPLSDHDQGGPPDRRWAIWSDAWNGWLQKETVTHGDPVWHMNPDAAMTWDDETRAVEFAGTLGGAGKGVCVKEWEPLPF